MYIYVARVGDKVNIIRCSGVVYITCTHRTRTEGWGNEGHRAWECGGGISEKPKRCDREISVEISENG